VELNTTLTTLSMAWAI